MPLALSTSWNAFRHSDAGSMLFEISKLGFKNLELSFNLTDAMLKELPRAASELGLKVLSLHNYCPIPQGLRREEALPDCYSLSSLDPQERNLAVRFTKRTIDTADSLGAHAVVLHCGRVEIEDKTRALILLYEKGLRDSVEFNAFKDAFMKERSQAGDSYLMRALSSLEELGAYAQRRGVLLGVENRYYYREIPSFEEIGVILSRLGGGNIFYWHDTGHARILQNLGLSGGDYLKSYNKYLAGIHLHNTIGCLDHQPLAKGDIDLAGLKPYLKKDSLKVIEVHRPALAQDIEDSRKFLEGAFSDII